MLPKISSAGWEVMNVVWERHPMTSTEVFAELPADREWAQKTVNTFLTRLVDKGVLKVSREGKSNAYSPRLKRDECVRQESESFLRRVFQGAAGPLMLHFCEHSELTDLDIAELERLLKTKKGKK